MAKILAPLQGAGQNGIRYRGSPQGPTPGHFLRTLPVRQMQPAASCWEAAGGEEEGGCWRA